MPDSSPCLGLPSPSDVSTSTSQLLSCPRCHAHVRAGSQWCTLCYSDLRPPPLVAEAQAVLPEPAPDEPLLVPTRRGKHSRPVDAPAGDTVARSPGSTLDEGEVERMLATLAAQSSAPLGRLAGRFDTPASKIGLMVGGTVLAGLVILLLMAVVGALL